MAGHEFIQQDLFIADLLADNNDGVLIGAGEYPPVGLPILRFNGVGFAVELYFPHGRQRDLFIAVLYPIFTFFIEPVNEKVRGQNAHIPIVVLVQLFVTRPAFQPPLQVLVDPRKRHLIHGLLDGDGTG